MLAKGNVWYVRHYEAYFDRVYVAYMFGSPHEPVTNGNTTLVSLGSGRGQKMDLARAGIVMISFNQKILANGIVAMSPLQLVNHK
jgi:hypothetical protein